MEIQSAFNAGVEGFNKATEIADNAARDIATQAASAPIDPELGQQNNRAIIDASTSSGELSNLNQSIVNLKVAEYQAKASVEVIKTADENLGTLLDVRV